MNVSRRHFLGRASGGIGATALATLLHAENEGIAPHFAPKAKRVIYLFQSGAPSQFETFDHKPLLKKLHGTELPDSIRQGQRLTGMTSTQTSFPVAQTIFD